MKTPSTYKITLFRRESQSEILGMWLIKPDGVVMATLC